MLKSIDKEKYGGDYHVTVLEQWKTFVESAESNTQKRLTANGLYLTLNAAILTAISFTPEKENLIMMILGICISILWIVSINSYRKLSSVKYDIINELERELPISPFTEEWTRLNTGKRYVKLTSVEDILPRFLLVIYLLSLLWPLIAPAVVSNQ